jgi:hypothetical protein
MRWDGFYVILCIHTEYFSWRFIKHFSCNVSTSLRVVYQHNHSFVLMVTFLGVTDRMCPYALLRPLSCHVYVIIPISSEWEPGAMWESWSKVGKQNTRSRNENGQGWGLLWCAILNAKANPGLLEWRDFTTWKRNIRNFCLCWAYFSLRHIMPEICQVC